MPGSTVHEKGCLCHASTSAPVHTLYKLSTAKYSIITCVFEKVIKGHGVLHARYRLPCGDYMPCGADIAC